jgi:hypothetical protein
VKKKYQNRLCAYCGTRQATTVDHVLSRKVFLTAGENDPPKAPACAICNGRKSELEAYVGTVLLFGSDHPDTPTRLEALGVPRLMKNQKLLRSLRSGIGQEWRKDQTTGLFRLTMGLPIESDKIEALSAMIARGLLWHHWQTTLDESQACVAFFLAPSGHAYFDKLFAHRTTKRINLKLRSGLFACVGAASEIDPHVSVWIFEFFGGLTLTDDPRDRDAVASKVGAITGSRTSLRPDAFGNAWR